MAGLAMNISLLSQLYDRYRFGLAIANVSGRRLLFPWPQITGLRFEREENWEVARWSRGSFVSAAWRGVVLNPSEVREFGYDVVPCDSDSPDEQFMRWRVKLNPGVYIVSYRMFMDERYHDLDSHCQIKNVREQAASEVAEAWLGDAVSNELRIVHPH